MHNSFDNIPIDNDNVPMLHSIHPPDLPPEGISGGRLPWKGDFFTGGYIHGYQTVVQAEGDMGDDLRCSNNSRRRTTGNTQSRRGHHRCGGTCPELFQQIGRYNSNIESIAEILGSIAMSELTPEELERIVTQAVIAGITAHGGCRVCPIPDDMASDIPHILGMVQDIGSGEVRRGIETLRKNHEFIESDRSLRSKIGIGVLMAVVLAIVTGMLSALWLGIKLVMAQQSGG